MEIQEIGRKPLGKEDISKARETFTKMKSYKDGTIHQSDLLDFCNMIGLPTTNEQADMYCIFWKANRGDDRIPIEEVMAGLQVMHDPKQLPLLLAKFFDRNGDGIISKEEFELGMKCLNMYNPEVYGEMGKVSFKDFVEQADENKDGKIQIEELAVWLSKS